ncbi:MAG: methionyl-tRNA formyltransferase, partial [Myxococcales bacterium]
MGTPPFAAVCLEALLETRHTVEAVVTQPDRPAGRGRGIHRSAVAELADSHGLETLQPERAGEPDFLERLAVLAPDLAVVVAYGRILPARAIEIPALGCINAHASLLPLLRGAAPIQHAILEGHERTGVTIIRINERMDAGDMLIAREIAIHSDDDCGSLTRRLAVISAELLVAAAADIAAGRDAARGQDESKATYAPPITKEHAWIEWSEDAARCERRVRAVRPRPG